ncbi:helix-turn-helix domain-containing protein [Planosporangium sp. 12N6]|uniref:helix-turn-helix domain-containing protein n=1 Tax=Planosporangium spinosum TaxID=3402278 RepID=UPI003CF1DC12
MLEQPAFGQRLRALRAQRRLSQAALADGVMSAGYLSRLESGARPPTPRAVETLARRLGVPLSAFESAESDATEPARPSVIAEVLATVVAADDAGLAELLSEALRAAPDCDPALRWQALWTLAQVRRGEGRQDEEYRLLKELVTLSESLTSPELRSRTCTGLACCARTLGHTAEARQYAQQAYELAEQASRAAQAGALQALISIEAEAGELATAQVHAVRLCQLTEDMAGTAHVEALWAAATVSTRQGDHAGGRKLLERALALLDSRADLVLWMRLRLAAASLYLQVDPPPLDEVRARLQEAAPVVSLLGTDLHQQEIRTLWAYLAVEEGRLDEAWDMCEQIAAEQSLLSFHDRVKFEATRARLQIRRGERDAGLHRMRELAKEAEDARNVELVAEIWRTLATALAEA